MKFKIIRLCKAIGAEILGLNLSSVTDTETLYKIKNAFHEHIVLLFRNQSLSPEQLVNFTSFFNLYLNPCFTLLI